MRQFLEEKRLLPEAIVAMNDSVALGIYKQCLCYLSASAEPLRKPNIVLILVDDMGCMGSEIQTPHLDRLAQQGLLFTHGYNASRCCPSRASLLTGLYQHRAGIGYMDGDKGSLA